MKPSDYGKYYWCIGLADTDRTKVYAYADQVEIGSNGSVVLRGPNNLVNLAFQAGQWVFVYALESDGFAAAVERWPGEVTGHPHETAAADTGAA